MVALFFALFLGLLLLMGLPLFGTIAVSTLSVPMLFGSTCNYTLLQVSDWNVAGNLNTTGITILLFILSGDVMSKGRLTERLFDTFAYFLGNKRCFMPIVSVLTCMFYGAISGSGPATTAAVGAMCYPILVQLGYEKRFSASLLIAAGCLGMVIPPSAPLTTAAGLANQLNTGVSVDLVTLYKFGAFGGVIAGVVLIIYAYIYCLHHGDGDRLKIQEWNKKIRERPFGSIFKESIWALLCPIIILGSIFVGIADTAQAAALSLIYAIFVSVWVYHTMTISEVGTVLKKSLLGAAPICILFAVANSFSGALVAMNLPTMMTEALLDSGFSPRILILLLLVLMLIFGTIMDCGAAMRILIPLTFPIIVAMDWNPYVFITSVIICQAVGLTTPPYGLCLFVMNPISGESVSALGKKVLPLCGILAIVGILIGLFPVLSSWIV